MMSPACARLWQPTRRVAFRCGLRSREPLYVIACIAQNISYTIDHTV